ncbi:pyruvate dehydrogenase complex dihydrolipoamide acetyltransferase [Amylibacter kogurei]|uniref:Acetyltransferase component of pyruvate dehydrogenase complex n=1 Tax=Paramylibacter kogurei TaxID=1889778 RepID=A0A2G5K5Z1_9RHOB|nr:pyruvate dehydrogenase complex dihydrolipoamide acetyltransferase [Amylibacter kogurei]PIB24951.1 pyruvate dehydrogenase complex dihydrolipoamide acetyltransferase [Amylibacter kogurei]
MAIQILMPALSPTMEEGTLAKWLVKEGDTVESGDILAEIETDKATMEFEAVDEGVIGKILVAEGSAGVKVNDPIAVLLEDGEDASAADNAKSAPAPKAEEKPAEEKPDTAKEAAAPKKAEPATPAPTTDKGDRVFATPLARRIAADKGIDLKSINGSGPKGRIVKANVENAKPGAAPAPAASASLAQSPSADQVKAMYQDREFEEVALDGMRKTIAARLTEAKQTVPHFYLRRGIKLDKLLSTRAEINAGLAESGVKLSVNDFIIKACAKALQDVPDANVVWADDRILKLDASDVAVAVAIEGGLFTPVIRDSDTKTLSTISAEMKDLAGRARDRKLAPHEYQGGSFAISNLGMMGIENFDAVINPPHGSILAVGAGMKKPVVGDDGSVSVATVMSVTLSVDHRAIDGALGATFLDAIVRYLENPLTIFA